MKFWHRSMPSLLHHGLKFQAIWFYTAWDISSFMRGTYKKSPCTLYFVRRHIILTIIGKIIGKIILGFYSSRGGISHLWWHCLWYRDHSDYCSLLLWHICWQITDCCRRTQLGQRWRCWTTHWDWVNQGSWKFWQHSPNLWHLVSIKINSFDCNW